MNFVCQLRLWLASNSNLRDPYSSLSDMHFLLFVYFSAICLHFSLLSVVFGCPFPFPPSEIPRGFVSNRVIVQNHEQTS